MMVGVSALVSRPARRDDAEAVAELVMAYERLLYGETTYAHEDLEAEWGGVGLARDSLVLVDEDDVVAFGSLHDRGELWRTDAYVHPAHQGRGIGTELALALEAIARS